MGYGGISKRYADTHYAATASAGVTSVAGKSGAVSLVKGDVGLGNVDNTSDVNKPVSTAQAAADALARIAWARNPDVLISGSVTRDSNDAATSAAVTWPDGTPGTYTATTVSSAFLGAVDAYTITYGSPVTKTYTQPAITRSATGAATNVPAIVVT
jgi:hypothetical protein